MGALMTICCGDNCGKNEPAIPLQDLAPDLKTGDVVIMRGARFFSDFIACVTRSSFSHTAMVVKYPDDPEIWLYCSTPNAGHFLPRGEERWRKGVMCIRFSDELKSGIYMDCVVRKLKDPLTDEQTEKLYKFYEETKHKAYEKSIVQLAYASCDCRCCGKSCCHNRRNLDEYFCSEWVATALQHIGIDLKNVSEYTPDDFAASESKSKRLRVARDLGKGVNEALESSQIHVEIPKDLDRSGWSIYCDCSW